MEFITVEQFQEQPLEVQKVFIDWWQPEIGDIFQFVDFDNDDSTIGVISGKKQIKIAKQGKGEYRIPLFTEGQLRKFIEDKTNCKNIELKGNIESDQYDLFCFKEIWSCCEEREYNKLGTNVLQAYWKVACMIVKEG